jgi:hypothetical protein
MGTSDISQPFTTSHGRTVEKCVKPNNDGPVNGRTVAKGGSGEKTYVWPGSKSDDLPYHGPVVEVPEWGPDPLDEHGAPAPAHPSTNGSGVSGPVLEPGLSRRRIRELADWYQDETHKRYNESRLDVAELDGELRLILREEVAFPEHIEIEMERVMQMVFAV